jgi:hypothetical protein
MCGFKLCTVRILLQAKDIDCDIEHPGAVIGRKLLLLSLLL